MTNKILIMWKKTSPQHNNIVRIKVYSSQERSIIIIYISYYKQLATETTLPLK